MTTEFLTDDVTADELAHWDDITGIELSERIAGTADYADDIDAEFSTADDQGIVSPAWLSSLLYSDYADPSDDDDRAQMNIPRSVLDNL